MKQNFNYHGHTKRCGHAVGEDEEYVQAAIAAGYSIIGFSDHAPYPGQYHAQERMDVGELDDYIRSIKELQQKYQGQIDIYIGMEIENYQAYKKELKQYRDMLDYCIIGQHSMALRDGNAVGDYYVENDDAHVLLYAGQIKEALDFQYLARRQRQLARPLIEAFVRSHPYAEGMPAAQYAQELLQAHPGINASMVEAYLQEASKAADVATVETPEAPAAEVTTEEAAVTPETVSSEASSADEAPVPEPTEALEQAPVTEVTSASKTAEATQCRSAEPPAVKESWKKLAHALRISGKIIFWLCAIIGCLLVLAALINFFSSSMIYYYGASYTLGVLVGQLVHAALFLFVGYVIVLVLNVLACLLDQGDPQIPFHHF